MTHLHEPGHYQIQLADTTGDSGWTQVSIATPWFNNHQVALFKFTGDDAAHLRTPRKSHMQINSLPPRSARNGLNLDGGNVAKSLKSP